MEGDFVARSSITKMIESTIGGNGNRVNGVIITNLEAISSRPDQSEDAPSFPPLDPSRAFHASNRIFHRLVFKSRNSSSSTMETPTDHAAFAFLHFLSTAIYEYIYTIVPLLQDPFSRGISRIVRCNSTCPPSNRPSYQIADALRVSRVSQIPRRISIKLGQISEVS